MVHACNLQFPATHICFCFKPRPFPCVLIAALSSLGQGSPAPRPRTATGPRLVRNRAAQQDVSGEQEKLHLLHPIDRITAWTIPDTPLPPPTPSVEKLSSTKPVSGAKKVGGRCSRANESPSEFVPPWAYILGLSSFFYPRCITTPHLLYIFQKCEQASPFLARLYLFYSFAATLSKEIKEYVWSVIFSYLSHFWKRRKIKRLLKYIFFSLEIGVDYENKIQKIVF